MRTIYATALLLALGCTQACRGSDAGAAPQGDAGTPNSDDVGVPQEEVGTPPGDVGAPEGDTRASAAIDISGISNTSGYAGTSVTFAGTGFGGVEGKVTFAGRPCTVTSWDATRVTAYVPEDAAPGSGDLIVRAGTLESAPKSFTVVAPAITITKPMRNALGFIRDKMRNPEGGVYTTLKDPAVADDGAYLGGHNVTSEHMGLTLWSAAAIYDHRLFEDSYRYVVTKMQSKRLGIISFGIDRKTGKPVLVSDGGVLMNINAPLDDLRVANGLIAGWDQWKDTRYRDAALRIGVGLVETSVSSPTDFPAYAGGLVTGGCYWEEAGTRKRTEHGVIPVDYSDLYTMKWFAGADSRWNKPIESATRMMEDAQLPNGQFYNSLLSSPYVFSGDFEYRDSVRGQKIKTIQSLWTAIHLARIGRKTAAQKALTFYKGLYDTNARVPEYLNPDGTDVTEPALAKTLKGGEPRIYGMLARLAIYLGDKAFASRVLREKILSDQVTDPGSPVFGAIGTSTEDGDAEAYNVLESILGLASEAGATTVSAVF